MQSFLRKTGRRTHMRNSAACQNTKHGMKKALIISE
jgi:hypothetical protein